jgi:hypothetical protein
MIRIEEYHDDWIEDFIEGGNSGSFIRITARHDTSAFVPKYIDYLKSLYPTASYLSFWFAAKHIIIPLDNYASI